MIVEDARTDERFADNPLVTGEPGVVFYAGAPLVTDAGHRLGMICVQDTRPRTISDAEKLTLRRMAQLTVRLLDLRRQRKHSQKLQDDLEHREHNTD